MAKVIERLRKGTSTVQIVLYGRGADARSQTGEYTVTGLTTDNAYQIRPYAIEDGTVVYGSALTFRTASQATVAYPIPRKIDMGMPSGVQWGEWNLGAQSITDTGEYYGWGYWEGMPGGITGTNDYYYARYSNNEPFIGDSIAGSDFDIVHMTWGGGWRMATSAEFDWLFDSNNSYQDPNEDQYITVNGSRVHGRKLHSKQNSSNMLFFPATGYYVGDEAVSDNYSRTWSSNKETKDGITTYVYYFVAGSITRKNHDHKYIRFPIRPVWDPVLAANSENYSFMALSSSTDMRVSMKDYTGNYVSNSQTEASFTYSFTLRSGVTEYGILVGNTGSELKINNSIRREAIPVELQEVVKIVLPSGDYWEKGSGDETPDASGSPEYVDLGLSVKWAKWNMGASSINEYGGYYGWGDPTGEVVSPYTNKYAVGNTSKNIAGNPKYDIATAKWGKGWRLPTQAEFEEMIAASGRSWTYDDSTGVKKYIATFPNGKTLYLPYDGYMNSSKTEKSYSAHLFYWTSEATTADSAQMPYYMHASGPRSFSFVSAEKYMHLMIRPVYDGDSSSGGDTPDTPVVPSETPSNAVDLGLYSGNLWATYNVGATSETESGVYVAWGELQEKINEGYFKENYAYWDANNTQYGGYSTALGNNIAGTKYDIAHVRWGGTWHMPTDSDFKELRDDCIWTQETRRGVLGYKVTGPNGNSIFLPCAGYYNGNDFLKDNEEGNYWCSTMYLFAREYQMGYAMNFSQADGYELTRYSRKGGLTVRPCMPRVE